MSIVLDEAHYPPDHPYNWPVIGSVEDLHAAALDHVRAFFATYYHPANASLVVAGDIEVDEAVDLVRAYFGEIPAGDAPAPVVPPAVDPRDRAASLRLEDRVELPRLYLTWDLTRALRGRRRRAGPGVRDPLRRQVVAAVPRAVA